MWLIGKVNQVQRKQLENMGKNISTVEEHDLGGVMEAYPIPKDNEEFVCIYIGGDMIDNVESLTRIQESSKEVSKQKLLHRDRLEIAEDNWTIKHAQLRDADYDILGSFDWTCDGDVYSMDFDYCDNNDPLGQTFSSEGKIIFDEGTVMIKDVIWEIFD
jgi:hypothetical protein